MRHVGSLARRVREFAEGTGYSVWRHSRATQRPRNEVTVEPWGQRHVGIEDVDRTDDALNGAVANQTAGGYQLDVEGAHGFLGERRVAMATTTRVRAHSRNLVEGVDQPPDALVDRQPGDGCRNSIHGCVRSGS